MLKFAIPTRKGNLFKHFGQSREFTILHVDEDQKKIISTKLITNENDEYGFPHWLFEQEIDIIIAGNIGEQALENLRKKNITVIAGAGRKPPA